MSRRVKSVKASIEKRAATENVRRRIIPAVRHSPEFRQIAELFIKPIVLHETMSGTYSHRLNYLFGTDYRQLISFVAHTRFVMIGEAIFTEAPHNAKRMINVGNILLIRTDVRTPNRVDVEDVKTGQVFRLTAAQYAIILEKLERITTCNQEDLQD